MIDYFAFYDLPVSFKPDTSVVKQRFYEHSKKYHPDFYINESEEKQAEVLELSTVNNKAYQVLSDPLKRLQYILELKGVLAEGENYALPQAFLMDMMDINEALMDLQLEPDAERLTAVKGEVASAEQSIMSEIESLSSKFEEADEQSRLELLAAIKDLYYRNKYLQRIRNSLKSAN
jgi:molecular chaperone HscB